MYIVSQRVMIIIIILHQYDFSIGLFPLVSPDTRYFLDFVPKKCVLHTLILK